MWNNENSPTEYNYARLRCLRVPDIGAGTDRLYFQPAGLRPWEKSVVNADSHDVHGGETGSDDTKRYFQRPLVVSALTFLQN